MRNLIIKIIREQTYNQLNTEKFIEKSKSVHGDKYDYSLVDYKNSLTPVKIICPIHGEFEQIPKSHMKGMGCKQCGINKLSQSQRMSTQDFIKAANQVHKNQYDYNKVDYKKSLQKVIITCPKHGDFLQTPNNHLRGVGCPKCGIEKPFNSEYFTVSSRTKTGLHPRCRECNRRKNSKWKVLEEVKKSGKKKCKSCGIEKDLDSFSKSYGEYSALRKDCKECCAIVAKENRLLNKTQNAEYNAIREKLNSAKTRAMQNGYEFDISVDDLMPFPSHCQVFGI
jgi:hypothetical protein